MVNRIDAFMNGELEGIENPYRTTNSGEMKVSMEGQKLVIGALRDYKRWKMDNKYGNNDTFSQIGSQVKRRQLKPLGN